MKEISNEELREIVEVEGDFYSAMQSVQSSHITDSRMRRLWRDANNALEELEEALYEPADRKLPTI